MKFKKAVSGVAASSLLAVGGIAITAPDANAVSSIIYNVGAYSVTLKDNCKTVVVPVNGSTNLKCGNRKAQVRLNFCVKFSGERSPVCNLQNHPDDQWNTTSWAIDRTVKTYRIA